MSSNQQSDLLRERIAGKWQMPLLAVASMLFLVSMIMLRPQPEAMTVADQVEQLRTFKSSLLLSEGQQLARQILEDGQYEPEELGPIYRELAEIQYRIHTMHAVRPAERLINTLANYEQAELLGEKLPGDDLACRGQVYEWLGQTSSALGQYRMALQALPSDPLSIRKRMLALMLQSSTTDRSRLHEELIALIEDAASQAPVLKWALTQEVELLIQERRVDDARDLVEAHIARLSDTDSALYAQHLSAWLTYHSGEYESAELILRDLRGKLKQRDELHAQTGWLLGQVVLRDDGPQRPMEATTFFQDVLESHTSGEYVTASKLGMAEALTDLGNFDEALEYYDDALADLRRQPATPLVNRGTVRSSLVVHSRVLQEKNNLDSALKYMQLAVDIIDIDDRAGQRIYLQDLVALKEFVANYYRDQSVKSSLTGDIDEAQSLGERSRELFLSAAEDYLTLHGIERSDEEASSDALWRAAGAFDQAGERRRTIDLLGEFILERPGSQHLPMALFKLGQAHQAEGEMLKAVEYYQRCLADYARTEPAQLSLIPLADCFVMLGPDYAQAAEETLLFILDPQPGQPFLFTPQSNVYRTALFKLGLVYSRNGRYEDAIARLDAALQRYPQDPNSTRATFLLADAYRQSGVDVGTLANEMANALRRDEMHRQKELRLRKAEELFDRVVGALSNHPVGAQTEMEALQLKLSYMYRADCAFDLGHFDRALGLYQEVAQRYPEDPVALFSYVQMISCLEKVDRLAEIKPALERAQYLTNKITPQALQSSLIRTRREDWQEVFAWLADTQKYR